MINSSKSVRRSRLYVMSAVVSGMLAGSGLLALGCGAPTADIRSTTQALSSTIRASAQATERNSEPTAANPGPHAASPEASHDLFSDLSRRLAPAAVYVPTYLPEEATLAEAWWPVMEVAGPEDYHGAEQSNPRVDDADGRAVTAQILFRVGEGWLAVLENYRGDVGDIVGRDVGEIQGHTARLYILNGGVAVQWSDAGLWYIVFGRQLSQTEVIKVALSMEKSLFDSSVSH